MQIFAGLQNAVAILSTLSQMTLHNQRYFTRQFFEMTDSGLKVNKRTLLDKFEFEIPFEQIHNKMKIQTITNNNLIVISASCFILATLFLLGTLSEISPLLYFAGFVFTFLVIVTRKKSITISTYIGEQIELFFTKTNRENVQEFATNIIKASNSFLLKKYGKVDKALPIDSQLNELKFLRDREVIDEEQFDNLKSQLLSRDNSNSIGFSR